MESPSPRRGRATAVEVGSGYTRGASTVGIPEYEA